MTGPALEGDLWPPKAMVDMLRHAAKVLKSNLKPVALVSLAVFGPMNLLAGILSRDSTHWLPLLVDILTALLLAQVAAGAVATIVVTRSRGDKPAAGAALRFAFRRFAPLALATLLIGISLVFGLLACGVGLIFVYPLWSFAVPAIVIGELNAPAGMRRSFQLVIARYWPIFVLRFVVLGITTTCILVLDSLSRAGASAIGGGWNWVPLVLGWSLSDAVVQPYSAVLYSLLYLHLERPADLEPPS